MKKIMFVLLALFAFVFMSCDSEPYVVGYVTSAKELSDALSNEKYGKDITIKAGDYTFTDDVYVGREVEISVVEGDDANLKFPEDKGLVVTDSLGNGNLSLKGINIEGTLLIQGGGSNSIYLEDSNVAKVVLDKTVDKNSNEQIPRLVIKGDAKIEKLDVQQEGVLDITESKIDAKPIENITVDKDIEEVVVVGDSRKIKDSLDESSKDKVKTGVARIGNEYYSTLEAAFTNAEDNSTIQLIDDYVLDSVIYLQNKKLTFDLFGNKVTAGDTVERTGGLISMVGGDLTIEDTSENKTGVIDVTTERILEDGYAAIYAGITVFPSDNYPAKLTINGGEIKANYYAISGNGTYKDDDCTVITVNGGKLTSIDGPAIYHPQNGNLIVNGGELSGTDTAIEIRAGELVITGGTFSASATPSESNPNGSGTTSKGSAIAIAQHSTKLPIIVNISGGIFNGYSAFYESNPQKNDANSLSKIKINITGGEFNAVKGSVAVYSEDCSGFISGGIYSSKPDFKYLADSLCAEMNGDKWEILEFDGILVSTEQELKEAVKVGGNIKIVSDIVLTEKAYNIGTNQDAFLFIPENTDIVFSGSGIISTKNNDSEITDIMLPAGAKNKDYIIYIGSNSSLSIDGDITVGGLLNDNPSSRAIYVSENAELIINDGLIRTFSANGGSTIFNSGHTIINGGTILSGSFAVGSDNGDLTISGGTMASVSSNKFKDANGKQYFTYAVRCGKNLVMTGGSVYGIQGGIATTMGIASFSGDVHAETTVDIFEKIEEATDKDTANAYKEYYKENSGSENVSLSELHYGLYAAGELGKVQPVNIYGGTYISGDKYGLWVGNSNDGGLGEFADVTIFDGVFKGKKGAVLVDTGKESDGYGKGSLKIKGGNYSSKINIESLLEDGYELVEEDSMFVVKKK